MPLRLFNTLTRKKEIFRPLKPKKAGLYCCGPTVYQYAHLGNLRTYLFEDTLRRVLEYNGYKIKHIMNITDVGHLTSDADEGEDKIEKGAKREGKSAKEITDFYFTAFQKDLAALNIKPPTLYIRATAHIKEQIKLVKILEKKGFTYQIKDGVYFNTSKLGDYGQLARLDLAGLKTGVRVARVEGKKSPTDFALWKLTPKGIKRQQEWSSPWGRGFPGWHIECSAMSQKYLGRQFDIHCGAVDLIPVHHENEIAQSQAAYGKIPAKYWLHGEHLLIDSDKMAKSLNNFVTLEQIAKIFNPLSFRYLALTAHYRSKLNLTWESLGAAQAALKNLHQALLDFGAQPAAKWRLMNLGGSLGVSSQNIKNVLKQIRKYQEAFLEKINDDLDMPQVIGLIWEMFDDKIIPPAAKKKLLLQFDRVLGLGLDKIKSIAPPVKIQRLAQEREKCRREKKWLKADMLRAKIEQEGWILEDTAQGPKLKAKQ